MRRLRRGDNLAALANDGGRARDVVSALHLGGKRERGARPVCGRTSPVVVPALRAGRVLAVQNVQAALAVDRLSFLVQDTATNE